ncbi:sin3 histone deacetylase corepressor complex component SDS3 isoform X1 [Phlebotomus argentipes]|uniref:sin3 histone deacetylase corepressor complex component SDS3 isoform X1 n=1 Tax=Phlebotomus argentipes TaxID=94469 RepID=UPI0028930BA1|nr:sin3 histone deacetylase corepressor complex component SDS3 isoform X1 [Phlebotomus argentipes]
MSYQNSPYYSANTNEDFEYEYDPSYDFIDQENDSEEGDTFSGTFPPISTHLGQYFRNFLDTEEASETDLAPHQRNQDEPVEIKEQMYQDKLSNLKKQLEELKNGSHAELVRRVKKLEYQYKERLRLNEIYRDYLVECVERDYILEKKAAVKEFEEKKTDLKENLLTDFEDRRKMIESEHNSMELTSDSMEVKPTVTRKLRRRPNEPIPVVEKRRKPTNGQLVLLLDEKDVENDLKLISRGKAMTPMRPPSLPNNGIPTSPAAIPASHHETPPVVEAKIEDGKLLYERRWFHRGQPVFVEGKDFHRFPATISAIGNDTICVKKLTDAGSKFKINTSHLSQGKVSIKRRAN